MAWFREESLGAAVRLCAVMSVAAALALGACGGSSNGTSEATQGGAGSSSGGLGSFAGDVSALKKAGFGYPAARGGTYPGQQLLSSIEASKSGATFDAARFSTVAQANAAAKPFVKLAQNHPGSARAQVIASTLYYATIQEASNRPL